MNSIKRTITPLEQMLAAVAIFALLLSLVYGAFPSVYAGDADEDALDGKVFMCHAKGDTYDEGKKEVAISSIIGGHDGHLDGGADGRGDIIPSFNYIDNKGDPQTFNGLNWDTAGKAIWNNGCNPLPTTGTLIVKKHVVNDNGGTATAADFTMNVTGTNPSKTSFSGDENGITVTLDAGSYSVDESAFAGYTKTLGADCSGTIAAGETKTCTITNDDDRPYLTLMKEVSGGTASPSDWTLSATGPVSFSGQGPTVSSVDVLLVAGTYDLSESGPAGYSASDWTCVGDGTQVDADTVTLGVGDSMRCTITNTYMPPTMGTLTILKGVENNDGGTLQPSDFSFLVGTTPVKSGEQNMFPAGDYVLSEIDQSGYVASPWRGHCSADGSITINAGSNHVCYITNDDIAPKLTVTKVVMNDSGTGKLGVEDFPLFVGTTAVTSGEQNTFTAGKYTVSETGNAGYAATFSGDCDPDGNLTLGVGDVKACTITNDDLDPTEAVITVNKVLVNEYGGTRAIQNFTFVMNGMNGGNQIAFEADGSNEFIVTAAGDYTVTETPAVEYETTYSESCSSLSKVKLGQAYSCTITNTHLPQCSDGINNDSDQLIDAEDPGCWTNPNDPGTYDPLDNSEADPKGSIMIEKVVTGEGSSKTQVFEFDPSWMYPTGNILVSEESGAAGWSNLNPGDYTVSEINIPAQYALTSVSCVNQWGTENVARTNGSVRIDISAGENVVCTFTNMHTPKDSENDEEHIIVKKEVTEGSDTETMFTFNPSWSETDFNLKDGLSYDSGDLAADASYSVTETLPSYWSQENVSCVSSDTERTEILPSGFVLNDGETITCTFLNDQELFQIYGYVWHDHNENDEWDGFESEGQEEDTEDPLTGWEVRATNGSLTKTTTTDENGYYTFTVPAGTWTITETVQEDWDQTFPNEGSHTVTVPELPEYTIGGNESFFASILNAVIPTVYAQTAYPTSYGAYNFGNNEEPSRSSGGGSSSGSRSHRGSVAGDSATVPEGEVLGEATSVMPVGAPNTGAGGTSPLTVPGTSPLVGILTTSVIFGTTRVKRNG